jgi:hypothetical protein
MKRINSTNATIDNEARNPGSPYEVPYAVAIIAVNMRAPK